MFLFCHSYVVIGRSIFYRAVMLAFIIVGLAIPHVVTTNSVPIPIEMHEMILAGRHVYDKQSTPTQRMDKPTNVNLSMYIEGMSSFRTQTMDFQLDVYFQQYWIDDRLRHNESKRILIRDQSVLNAMWHPDIYFANARIAEFHSVTQPNFLLWLEPDGSILYDTRVSMTVICSMNLAKWPLDSQRCHLRILSYAYDVNQLTIAWIKEDPITRNMAITLSDMHIIELSPGLCDGNYSTGEWSCVTAEFFVTREIMHHIMQSYVPTSLIVIISWFSFWLDVEAVPARVSLAITTLLTLSTQASTARMALPEVSYAKAIDVWSSTCMLFVFGVMIEFTMCNYVQRQAMSKMSPEEKLQKKRSAIEDNNANGGSNFGMKARSLLDRAKALTKYAEQRQLIESYADDEATPVPQRYRAAAGDMASAVTYAANGECSSSVNGNSSVAITRPTTVVVRNDGACRLAHWSAVSIDDSDPCVGTPSTPGSVNGSKKLWNKIRHSAVGTSKFTKAVSDKWGSAVKLQKTKKQFARSEAKKIDQISRWSFPLAFAIFNIVYWTYYLVIFET